MIRLDIKDLKNQLPIINRIVAKRSAIPMLETIKISGTKEGVSLLATDLDTFYSCQVAGSGKGDYHVDPHFLANIARTTTGGVITIQRENKQVFIKADDSVWTIPDLSIKDFPEMPSLPKADVFIYGAEFRKAITLSKFAITTEKSRFTLNSAKTLINKGFEMVATNGHQLTYFHDNIAGFTKNGGEVNYLLPAHILELALKFKVETYGLAVDATHISLTTEQGTLITRKPTGDFPNYERILPKESDFTGSVIFRADEMLKACKQAKFSQSRWRMHPRLLLSINQTGISIKAGFDLDSTYGTTVRAVAEGNEIAIGFNYDYLIDFLELVGKGDIKLSFTDSNNVTQLEAVEKHGYEYKMIVMPLRM